MLAALEGMIQAIAPLHIRVSPGVRFDVPGELRVGSSGAALTAILGGSATWDPPSIGNGLTGASTVTVTGAVAGDACVCGLTTMTGDRWQTSCAVDAADTARYTIENRTGGTVNLDSGTLRCLVFKSS